MARHSFLFCTILAFSLASTEPCESSAGSSIGLSLHSTKNASGDWIISVETRRLTIEEDPREISVKVRHETKICGKKEIEQLIAVALVYPSLHDTSMPGAIEPSTTRTTSTTTTATTPPPPPTTTITTTTPKSCPHSGYHLYPGFNCYKAFPSNGERKNWTNAREQCMGDGGDLMVIETEREKKEVYIPLRNSVKWTSGAWVGVYIPQGGNNWMSVKGEPARSTWWLPGQPDGNADRKCAAADNTGLLWNSRCEALWNFIIAVVVVNIAGIVRLQITLHSQQLT